MISFTSDYVTGAHPSVLQRLIDTNAEAVESYGADVYSESAKAKIKAACGCPEAEVFFLVGGTQSNKVVISSMLREHEGVIAAVTGHISGHEAGAVEGGGHKVIALPQKDGKIEAAELEKYLKTFYADANHEHMVFPGMVYISHPTEYGTLYSKAELERLSELCREYDMSLFLDGARLAYGLMSRQTDVSLEDITRLCDVFYIGGTKVGALCGEAVVFTKNNMPKHFMTVAKRHGALLAKGRLLGVQFDALFTDRLYFNIGKHAIDMAEELKRVFTEKGYKFFLESPTNQQFIVLDNVKMKELSKTVAFGFWEKYDENNTVVRFATGWSTTMDDIKALEAIL